MLQHKPVLLPEVLDHLVIQPDGIYIDATFGRGGHAREILLRLSAQGKLFALDKDPEAVMSAKQDPIFNDQRFQIQQMSFNYLKAFAEQQNILDKVSGILFDLGVSSPQLEDPLRGFSFLKEGPLDMRMDPTHGITAAQWISAAKESEIMQVLKDYGEERYARRIAAAIVRERKLQPITTTTQLATIVAEANPRWEKRKHPATRTFQALRIFINQELENLSKTLEQSLEVLALKGRLAVISFHSLEDRIVKQFMQSQARAVKPRLHLLAKIKPSYQEIKKNPRSRSALLRVAEKIA